MPSLITEHQQWKDDTTSELLVNGNVYIGAVGLDPQVLANQITIYSDRALTTPILNPQTTNSNGQTENKIWIPGDNYSIAVTNSADVVKYSELDNGLGIFTAGNDLGSELIPFIQDSVNAVATTVQEKLREWVSVKDFGAVGDGVTDDTTAIQAAIDSIPSAGGSIYFPVGIYLISSTLIVSTESISLTGEGGNYFFGSVKYNSGSILLWDSGTTGDIMVKCMPGQTVEPIIAPQIRNINLDGNGVATIGLRVEACIQGIFSKISIRHCVTAALQTGVTSLVGYTGLNYTHSCVFESFWIDQFLTGDGDGIDINGSTTGTTTVCTFKDIHVHYHNSNAITINIGDSNLFLGLFLGRDTGGTGIGLELMGRDVSGKSVNSNTFIEIVSGKGGIVSRSGTTASAVGNIIYGLGIDTLNLFPVIETGSTLQYHINTDAVTGGAASLSQNLLYLSGSNARGIWFRSGFSGTDGIDFKDGAYSAAMMRYKNNTPIRARNNADSADVEVGRMNTGDEWEFKSTVRIAAGKSLSFASTAGINTAASTTTRASIKLPHGAAPTSPVDGDMWTTTAGLYVRINGVTVGPLS